GPEPTTPTPTGEVTPPTLTVPPLPSGPVTVAIAVGGFGLPTVAVAPGPVEVGPEPTTPTPTGEVTPPTLTFAPLPCGPVTLTSDVGGFGLPIVAAAAGPVEVGPDAVAPMPTGAVTPPTLTFAPLPC